MKTQSRAMPMRSAYSSSLPRRASGVFPGTPDRWQWTSQISVTRAAAKSEIRRPKEVRIPRSEGRGAQAYSAFGFWLSFGLRPSDFGFLWSFFAPHRSMSRILSLEVPEARPIEPFAQIHFRHSHRAPILRLCQHTTFAIVNRRDHPLRRDIGIGAADDKHVVLTGARSHEQGVAAGNRERDHFRPTIA